MQTAKGYAIVRNNPVTNDMEYWHDGSNKFVESMLNETRLNAVQNISLWLTRDLADQRAMALQSKYADLGIAPIEISAKVGGPVLPVTVATHRKLD
jgi:hypothetical protein